MKKDCLIEEDLKYIWHPCTQMKDHETLPLVPIKKGEGVYLYDFEDNAYIDGVSSWWVNLFGHCHPYINQKVKEQIDTLEHVIFAGFTHEPIIQLSQRLCALAPKGLQKCFYADNGSSAIEVALKMSFQYHKNRGEKRPFFVSLSNSYHGETIGALAIGDVKLYKEIFEDILLQTLQAPVPKDQSEEAAREAALGLEKVFQAYEGKVAAFIIEPLVQCAGGMHMYHPLYITLARKLCDSYDIHLIADEIAVGFGRTGKMFACEYAGVSPDFMTLSKGLTGGYLPLSVVLTTQKVYEAFYGDYVEFKAFLHSHSYTGNPLACSAANATLDIFEQESILEKNEEKIAFIAEQLERFKALPNVQTIRQTGMIAAVELKEYPIDFRVNLKIFEYAMKKGVILRPLGNIVYFMPPYVITCKEIERMMDVAYEAIVSVNDL
ncbi:adenosylmethionine--8-amino-7-oxononanoate transaminase [Sulfurospirillum deleyianum]|uniref:Adenosylmethionine-8-amino-7-oxononanoate aminotransferase n=1 Tax=Sulfurospirillum deleyianum (strain ATCC 51133 / DSM 6946 / 5175) TaxID=525898 RepID=D1B2X3_SULD5|nr:adenosylmethionine--8-amino-7-oxononanoate transaminase [Sulfurospirillum deleyianum]ACZ12443.1 adenosylmethionine-8-amino-7-oxononanoateaminotr ansferase [Sulfurospirillum deleyianum DSM 6946]